MQPIQRVTPATIEVLKCIYSFDGLGVWGLEISKSTGFKTGTIYPLLERLESLGWLESEWELEADRNGPRRKNYKLTREAFDEIRELLEKPSSARHDEVAWNFALRQSLLG